MVIDGERALARARAGVSGRLAGVPLLVKDLIDVDRPADHLRLEACTPTTSRARPRRACARSRPRARSSWRPPPATSSRGASAARTRTGATPATPHHPGRITGGSSSGNAAALAVGMGALALGTDTGGSVRLPAAGCGVVGLKTPFGAISDRGRLPARAGPRHRRADGAHGRGLRARLVDPQRRAGAGAVAGGQADRQARAPSRAWARRRPRRTTRAPTRSPASRSSCRCRRPTCGRCSTAARRRRTAGCIRERADEYGPAISAKLDRALATTPEAVRACPRRDGRVAASGGGRPAGGRDRLPGAGPPRAARGRARRSTSSGIPFTAYARTFNFLGWPAIAIGGLQLAARDMRTLLEASLAWPLCR